MKLEFTKSFKKSFVKLASKNRKQVESRLRIFVVDQFDPTLNNHPLVGKYKGYRSINITGDLRAHYFILKKDTALFVKLGSHSELYN